MRSGGMVAVVVVLALGACGNGGSNVKSAEPSTTTSTTVPDTTTSTVAPTTTVPAPTTTRTTIPPPKPLCSTVTGAPRDNSGWQSGYSSDPGADAPVTVTACISDTHPRAGHAVSLHITASDPDAVIPADDECAVFVSWETDPGSLCYDVTGPPMTPLPAPPPKSPGSVDTTRTHTFAKAGDFTVEVDVTTGGDPYKNPYSSRASVKLPVHVTA